MNQRRTIDDTGPRPTPDRVLHLVRDSTPAASAGRPPARGWLSRLLGRFAGRSAATAPKAVPGASRPHTSKATTAETTGNGAAARRRPSTDPLRVVGRVGSSTIPKLLWALASGTRSGKLTVVRRQATAELLVSRGRLVYGAITCPERTLGNLLVTAGSLQEEALLDCLRRQKLEAEARPLGALLLEMGALDKAVLRTAVERQAEGVIAALLGFSDGFFKFESLGLNGERVGHYSMEEGMALRDVLERFELDSCAEALPAPHGLDSRATHQVRPRVSAMSLRDFFRDFGDASSGQDLVEELMSIAAQHLDRALLFVNGGDSVWPAAQVGVPEPGVSREDSPCDPRVDLGPPSIFSSVLECGATVQGPLVPTRANAEFLEQLGGEVPCEAIAIPMRLDGQLLLILYGDVLDDRPITAAAQLEAVAQDTADALERLLWKQRVRRLEERVDEALRRQSAAEAAAPSTSELEVDLERLRKEGVVLFSRRSPRSRPDSRVS